MGGVGQAAATVRGHNSAWNKFIEFLTGKGSDVSSLTPQNFKDFHGEFAGYLLQLKVNRTGAQNYLAPGTALEYLSNVFSYAKQFYRDEFGWHLTLRDGIMDNNQGWHQKCYANLRKALAERSNTDGTPDGSRDTVPLGRQAIKNMSLQFFKSMHDGSVGYRKHLDYGLACTVNYHAIGRAGECSMLSFKTCYWDENLGCFVLHWPEAKTSETKWIHMFPAAPQHGWKLDFYFWMALYHMMDKHNETTTVEDHWVFKTLAAASSASTIVNNGITHCQEKGIIGVPRNATPTSIRCGAITDAIRGGCTLAETATRSGHNVDPLCALWEYWHKAVEMDCVTGQNLAGWQNFRGKKYHPPSVQCILDSLGERPNKGTILNNFVQMFLNINIDDLSHTGAHWRLTETCFASFVMYFEDVYNAYDDARNNKVIRIAIDKMRDFDAQLLREPDGVALIEGVGGFLAWGKLVKNKFLLDNAENLVSSNTADIAESVRNSIGAVSTAINDLRAENEELRRETRDQRREISGLKEQLTSLQTTMNEVLQLSKQQAIAMREMNTAHIRHTSPPPRQPNTNIRPRQRDGVDDRDSDEEASYANRDLNVRNRAGPPASSPADLVQSSHHNLRGRSNTPSPQRQLASSSSSDRPNAPTGGGNATSSAATPPVTVNAFAVMAQSSRSLQTDPYPTHQSKCGLLEKFLQNCYTQSPEVYLQSMDASKKKYTLTLYLFCLTKLSVAVKAILDAPAPSLADANATILRNEKIKGFDKWAQSCMDALRFEEEHAGYANLSHKNKKKGGTVDTLPEKTLKNRNLPTVADRWQKLCSYWNSKQMKPFTFL